MMVPAYQEDRLVIANKMIEVIGRHGRKFLFNEHNGFTKMDLEKGRVYVTDCYTGKRFKATESSWSKKGFSSGGTMRRLLEDLAEYVETGMPMPRGHFQTRRYSYGDQWGYGEEEMKKVEEQAFSLLGYASTEAQAPA
jgi:hypothetical protein